MSKFSNWLLNELEGRGMSQSELARKTKLTRQAISYYISDKSKRPDDDALKNIAKAFDMPTEQIYRAAGLLPPKLKVDEEIEDLLHEIAKLPKDDQREILEFVKVKNKLREGKNDKSNQGGNHRGASR
jgi:transcriptional regulator with XRE-family HTH domain